MVYEGGRPRLNFFKSKLMRSGGGWAAIAYSLRMARQVGWRRMWAALRAKNACKTCAVGMGGQSGGMRNELGSWPEVCKKSFQAMVADMRGAIPPDFFQRYSIAQLQTLSPRELEVCGRLTAPLYAGPSDSHFRVVSWDFALDRLCAQLQITPPTRSFFYASGRSSNEAGFLLQLFARVYGTNFVNNCSYYCHQASGVGLMRTLGTSTATVTLADVEKADLFILLGGNPASNHPRLMRTLMNIRRRGGQVVVINPVKEIGLVNFRVPSDPWSLLFGSRIAGMYLQPHIGGDIALLTGVAKAVMERGAIDVQFIEQCTDGFVDFADAVERTSWREIEHASGVERHAIERLAARYMRSRHAVFGWTMGITHHEHGVDNVQAIVNLALLRGMVGRRHAGLLPIRGHSNVQGLGTVGVVPNLKDAFFQNTERLLGVDLPRAPGLDTMACMQAAHRGDMSLAVCLGGNLYGSNPHSQFAHEALARLDMVAYLSTALNIGHAWGRAKETLILPVLVRDEEAQATTQESMFNFVRLSDGGPRRLAGPRSEVDVLSHVAEAVLGDRSPVRWQDLRTHCHIREMISQIVPGMERLAELDRTQTEFHIAGRVTHERRFGTPNGRAQFTVNAIPHREPAPNALRLMTVRSEGQFNTVVYEEADTYRGQERRDVIMLSKRDIARFGLSENQRVTVKSVVGQMRNILVRSLDIRPGNAVMYYPEANVLVPTTTDPHSKTPAFKSVEITLGIEDAPIAERVGLVSLRTV